MSEVKMIGDAVKNMPWQEGPAEFSGAPVWRYSENPIIGRNPVKEVARIFNSAVMPYGDEFIGVFRGEQTNGIPYIYLGRSKDAIHWNFDENKIQFVDEEGTGKLLGVHIAGAHASDLIAEATLALQKGCTARELFETIHAHPTLSEGLYEAAGMLA